MAIEEAFRFGLLDIPGIMPQEERAAYLEETYQCTKLPCPANSVNYQSIAVAVFVVDFLATRGFARGLLKEQESMARTVNAVQEIASLLAGYDVEQVAAGIAVGVAAAAAAGAAVVAVTAAVAAVAGAVVVAVAVATANVAVVAAGAAAGAAVVAVAAAAGVGAVVSAAAVARPNRITYTRITPHT